MRGPNLLRRLFTKYSATKLSLGPVPSRTAIPRKAAGLVRMWALAGLIGVLAGSVVASCVVTDPDYCLTNNQCPTVEGDGGQTQLVCHPTRHTCIPKGGLNSCTTDADCNSDYRTPRCDDGVCSACLYNDTSDKSCAQRTDGRKLCVNASDGSGGTLCVACNVNSDCQDPATPICDGQACRKCASHQDCEGTLVCDNGAPCTDSLVCIQDGDLPGNLAGRCAQNGSGSSGRVIYVNNTVPKVDANTGTDFTVPLYTLHAAVDAARTGGRRYIRLVGLFTDWLGTEQNYIVKDTAYSFIGAPVKKVDPTVMATVRGRNTLFQVTGTGSLTLDQIALIQDSSGTSSNSVTCLNSAPTPPTLVIRRSTFTGNTSPTAMMAYTAAITVSNCNTTLDGNIIGLDKFSDLSTSTEVNATAISIVDINSTAPTYLIQNNLIIGNAGYGLDLSAVGHGTGKFTFRFNTIAYNGRGQMGVTSGIDCPGVPSTLEFSNSIVVGNSLSAGSQFSQGNNCNLKGVVVGTAEMGTTLGTGVIKLDPKLDPDFRLHLGPENSACCIDQVIPADSLPAFDVDGVARPQNGKWDYGASEYKP